MKLRHLKGPILENAFLLIHKITRLEDDEDNGINKKWCGGLGAEMTRDANWEVQSYDSETTLETQQHKRRRQQWAVNKEQSTI